MPRNSIWLILALTILSVWINLPNTNFLPTSWNIQIKNLHLNLDPLTPGNWGGKFPLKLGLDLQGGTELVLQTQMDKIPPGDRDSALESAKQVIERRVNFFGVSESTVQTAKVGQDRRILVELPGVKDLNSAVNLVGKTAQLDFRELIASPSAESSPSAFYNNFKTTGLTGADLKRAQVVFSGTRNSSSPQVSLEFTSDGAKKFAEITKRNVGKPLAIFLDSEPLDKDRQPPIVQQEIIGGNAVISGNFTTEEAKKLAIQLNAGALPVPIKVLEQRTIGATLGESSIHLSIIAGVIGLVSVMVFMVAFYGLLGVVANLALIIYTLLVLAVFRTGLFIIPPITLTLAGIAGFILSIGMAVDANILTFERMKEELRSGKNPKIALEQGFLRAWTSIRDSNISSLITASILYTLGTSIVKGFALTLAIGVLISMFSSVLITRNFLRMLPRFKK